MPNSIVPVANTSDREAMRVLCQRLHTWCGVSLDESKSYLINNRLREWMSEVGVSDLATLVKRADSSTGMAIRDRIVDLLTTHETLFFRDQSPFEALAKVIIPEAREKASMGRPRLRVWSAACSSGQEPYSIAIKLIESVPDIANWDVSILATDVSGATVRRAREGLFHDHEVRRGVSASQQTRFFQREGDEMRINASIRKMITFQVGNLTAAHQPTGPFDLIYCRNVLIYFQPDDAKRVLKTVTSRLAPGGRLFVGCSEVLRDVGDFLVSQRAGQATCYVHSDQKSTTRTLSSTGLSTSTKA